MSETKKLLEELDGKVSGLLAKVSETNANSLKLTQEIANLKRELANKENALELIKKENEALKIERPKVNQDDLKNKIGEMVKEIDRCISLLKV
jgi:chromosome segregation ATPase